MVGGVVVKERRADEEIRSIVGWEMGIVDSAPVVRPLAPEAR